MRIKSICIIIFFILLQGCAGLEVPDNENYKANCPEEDQYSRNYSATTYSILELECERCPDKGLVLFFLPFIVVSDTLVLPATIWFQYKYGDICMEKPGSYGSYRDSY